MGSAFLKGYQLISILIALADGILAAKSFQKRTPSGRFLGLACVGAAVVDISYLISILSSSYLLMSAMSSIYFVTIDFMLLCLLEFTVFFTKGSFSRSGRILIRLLLAYAIFELLVFSVNPFREIAIHYVPRNTAIARFSYQMKPLYILHLGYTYFMVAAVLWMLVRKQLRVPREYRSQYTYVVLGILGVVGVNGIFLFWPEVSVYSLLDYSICGYSFTAALLYWSCFEYSTHGMLDTLKTRIFENIGQGIVLFDYNDQLILHNARADELLGGIHPEACLHLKDFAKQYDLPLSSGAEDDSICVQVYPQADRELRPLRCDIRSLRNDTGQCLGQLFVFSDAALETDLLTGFQDWDSFQVFARTSRSSFPTPTAVAICDINGLSVINSTMGNQAGNQKIQQLAGVMRSVFPKQTYYVRGVEASLIALSSHSTEAQMHEYMRQIKSLCSDPMQYAVSTTDDASPDILDAIQVAAKAMRAKKLLDRKSTHSEMLTSLIRALQECDSDTEHHVQRTQQMGAALGKRIELTDSQQSNLSLLCLLHDIGKIGIPLEILNKPGRLTPEEWKILQSHTEKGYKIASSNNELREIAGDIRHHHERWDGKGYPDGLSRETIPLLARIIAVVDAYDAMTNDRSYRRAKSPADAIQELRRCAGSQFDPFIVSEFIQMLKENPQDYIMQPERAQSADSRTLEPSPVSHGAESACTHVHPVPYSRYLLDNSMRIISADDNFTKLTGYTQEDLQEHPMYQADLIPDEERMEYLCQTNAGLACSTMLFQEHSLRRKDGTNTYVFCLGRVYFDSAVREERSEIIVVDLSQTYSMKMLAQAEENKAQIRLKHWEETYRRDSLTGLLNHAAFRSDVEQRLLEGRYQVMMLMLDVDHFKEYNDTYGHHDGDRFLILVAQALNLALRKEDCACRMGGDEFAAALFFKIGTPEDTIRMRAQQVYDKVNLALKSAEHQTGISMGVAVCQGEGTFNQLYEASDNALYQAKSGGRGRMVIHPGSLCGDSAVPGT